MSRTKIRKTLKTFCQLTIISKGLCERILTVSAAETAAVEALDTQSVSDELLLELWDASNSDENDSKDSESEEEDELPVGNRANCYGRRVGNWRLQYSMTTNHFFGRRKGGGGRGSP